MSDYVVQHSSDGGSTWQSVEDGVSTATTAIVTGLVNGTGYRFRVAAVNSVGTGAWSGPSAAVVPATTAGKATAVAAVAANAQATISWTAPASDGGAAVSDYVVQHSSDGGTTWQAVEDGVSTATTATVIGLVNGTSYRFRVAAVNAVGTGTWSDPSAAVTPVGLPEATTGLTATPGDGVVSLAWTAPASNGGRAIVDYIIERSSDGAKTWTRFARGASTATTAIVGGLVNGTPYVFRVSAANGVGTGPATAASSVAIPSKSAGAPTALKATRGDGQISLSWKAPAVNGGSPITDYAVESSRDGGQTWTRFTRGASTATTAIVGKLANGTSYVFRVAAVNSVGPGAWTAKTAAVIPAGRASVPLDLVVVRGNARMTLSWKAPASTGGVPITDYLLQSSTDGGSTWKQVADKIAPTTTATATGLVNGTSYVFRVAAMNGVGAGAYGATSASVVPATLAGIPTALTATRGNGEVRLTWKAPASTGGVAITDYTVERSTDGGKTWTPVADAVSTAPAAVVGGLVNGTRYVFRVAAMNEVGTGPFTAKSAAVIPATNPGEPTQLVATRGNAKVTLSWKAPVVTGGVSLTDYAVEWSADNGATWKKLVRAPSAATTATVTGLTNTVSYRLRVAAKNAAGLQSAFVEAVSKGTVA